MFLNFYFWSWIFETTPKFWAAPCKNESNLLLVRFTVCIESCLPIGWRTFIWWKNPPKCSSILVWVAEWWNCLHASRNPKNNWCLSRIYGIRFGEKDRGLSTYKPWTEQAGDWVQFCMKRLRTLKLFQIFSTEIKKSKTYIAVDVLLKGFPMVPLSCRSNLAGRYL